VKLKWIGVAPVVGFLLIVGGLTLYATAEADFGAYLAVVGFVITAAAVRAGRPYTWTRY
jgi:hypothetical protein